MHVVIAPIELPSSRTTRAAAHWLLRAVVALRVYCGWRFPPGSTLGSAPTLYLNFAYGLIILLLISLVLANKAIYMYVKSSIWCVTFPLSREWTAAQTAEKERLASEQRHADRLYDLKACELDQRAVDLACAEAETRRNITIATKEYNLALVSGIFDT